jgi:hypothetical protein
LPGSFKEFITQPRTGKASAKISGVASNTFHAGEKTKRKLHLGLEPEPLGLLENSAETISFFEQLRAEHQKRPAPREHSRRQLRHLPFRVEFEEPRKRNCRVAKSRNQNQQNPFKLRAENQADAGNARAALKKFADDVYLHQVIARGANGKLKFFRDLPDALAEKLPI